MDIGEKIKDLRQLKNLTQEELADRCELTKGYISQLENNLTSPSIEALKDILLALGTSLSDFFDDSEEIVVFKKKDYIEKQYDTNKTTWLVPSAQKYSMEPIVMELEKDAVCDTDTPHEGEEFGYVLSGKIILLLGKKSYEVKKGETFYYSASKPHSIKNIFDGKSTILWVSCPPNF